MTTNAEQVSGQPTHHTAASVADEVSRIVAVWSDNDDVPAGLVAEIETLAGSVRSQTAIEMPSADSAIEALARTISVTAASISSYQHYTKEPLGSMTGLLVDTVTEWANQWSVSSELEGQMIRLVVGKIEAPEILARLDGGLSTDLNSILRDRILGFHAASVLRDHNARRFNIETPETSN